VKRKAFTPSERVYIAKAIEGQEREKAKERQAQAGKNHGRGKIASGKFPEAIERGVRVATAQKTGFWRPVY